MTPRERYIETLTHGTPDRIPFQPGGPRESTIAAWRRQGLDDGTHWFAVLCDEVGVPPERPSQPSVDLGVDFRLRPRFEEKVLERREDTLVVQDWKGNVCEISDRYDVTYLRNAKDFVTRSWIRCPVESRDDWEAMKSRYDPHDPGRFPADFEVRCAQAARRDWVLSVAVSGPFWQLREWCGFEGLCMMMIEQPDLVAEMAAFWTEFVDAMLPRILAGVAFDRLFISEDMAYKEKAMISPAMTREFCLPSWRRWAARCRNAGVPLIDMDSDGYVGELIPLWIESGINVSDPMEAAAGNDLPAASERYGTEMAWRMGVDKRAMARGGEAIAAELDRLAPVVRRGGYIPGCDHGIPSDVSWPAMIDYARRLAELTGWR